MSEQLDLPLPLTLRDLRRRLRPMAAIVAEDADPFTHRPRVTVDVRGREYEVLGSVGGDLEELRRRALSFVLSVEFRRPGRPKRRKTKAWLGRGRGGF